MPADTIRIAQTKNAEDGIEVRIFRGSLSGHEFMTLKSGENSFVIHDEEQARQLVAAIGHVADLTDWETK